jgi:hypothetical protein
MSMQARTTAQIWKLRAAGRFAFITGPPEGCNDHGAGKLKPIFASITRTIKGGNSTAFATDADYAKTGWDGNATTASPILRVKVSGSETVTTSIGVMLLWGDQLSTINGMTTPSISKALEFFLPWCRQFPASRALENSKAESIRGAEKGRLRNAELWNHA